jgi:hypothetical protein
MCNNLLKLNKFISQKTVELKTLRDKIFRFEANLQSLPYLLSLASSRDEIIL